MVKLIADFFFALAVFLVGVGFMFATVSEQDAALGSVCLAGLCIGWAALLRIVFKPQNRSLSR